LVLRGTPRYLTSKTPYGICRTWRISCFTRGGTPARKTELLEGLAFSPESSSNSLRATRMAWTESMEPLEKISKSTAKQR